MEIFITLLKISYKQNNLYIAFTLVLRRIKPLLAYFDKIFFPILSFFPFNLLFMFDESLYYG